METTEIWKQVIGYENLYEVSCNGNIKNVSNDYRLKPSKNKVTGYVRVGLTKNKKSETLYVHRIVAQAFIPNKENKKEVNHIDGNKENCCVSNLEWVTRKENVHHAFETGLNQAAFKLRGEKGSNAKLTEKEVISIRIHHKCRTKTVKELSEMYGTTTSNINMIVYGYSWKHLL